MQIRIEGGHTLIDGRLEIASVHVDSDSGAIACSTAMQQQSSASMRPACWSCPGSSTFTAMHSSGK
jgi:hypothetical protein